jgi:hypothetical protein
VASSTASFSVSAWFRFASGRTGLLITWPSGTRSVVAPSGTTRTLWSWSARANSGSHASFTSDASEQTRLGLFDYFDFCVIAMDAKVGEGSVCRFFD